jgi:hypothetical protein
LEDVPCVCFFILVDRPFLRDLAHANLPACSFKGKFKTRPDRLFLAFKPIREHRAFQFFDIQLRCVFVELRACLSLSDDIFVFFRPDVVFFFQKVNLLV